MLVGAPEPGLPSTVSIEAISGLPFVTYEESRYVFGRWFKSVLSRQPGGIRALHHFERLEEVIESVKLNRGVSIVPRAAVERDLAKGTLSALSTRRRCFNTNYLITRVGWEPGPELLALHEGLRRQ